jgi:hypothetical protein
MCVLDIILSLMDKLEIANGILEDIPPSGWTVSA